MKMNQKVGVAGQVLGNGWSPIPKFRCVLHFSFIVLFAINVTSTVALCICQILFISS